MEYFDFCALILAW